MRGIDRVNHHDSLLENDYVLKLRDRIRFSKMHQAYQWLLFDADDTLFDYAQGEHSALRDTFAEFGLPFDARTLDLYREFNHRLWLRFEKHEVTGDQIRRERFAELFHTLELPEPAGLGDRYIDYLGAQTTLMNDAHDTVATLHKTYRLVVITNGMMRVQRPRLARSILEPYIFDLIISEECGAAKPSREIFDYAFARMGRPRKEQVLIVGDSLTSDMAGGVAYGIDTCWYNPKCLPHPQELELTYEIHSLRELVPLLTAADSSYLR